MQINQLITLFSGIITASFSESIIYSDVILQQSDLPTQEGVPSTPTVFFQQVYDHIYGGAKKTNVYDNNTQEMTHSETQTYETRFQFQTLYPQNPSIVGPTASDLANFIRSVLQSDATIQQLATNNVWIYRVLDVPNIWFEDDKDVFEAAPSFDIIFVRETTYSYIIPSTNTVKPGIYPV